MKKGDDNGSPSEEKVVKTTLLIHSSPLQLQLQSSISSNPDEIRNIGLEVDEPTTSSSIPLAVAQIPGSSSRGVPSSPQPSVDRLSVSFAVDADNRSWTTSEEIEPLEGRSRISSTRSKRRDSVYSTHKMAASPPQVSSEGAEVQQGARLSANLTDEDDDYSASMNAILSRRASCRKVKGLGKRRTSSPFDSDRRRSSVFTTSSGDTAITMEGGAEGGAVSQEQIFEQLKLHKEVLESVRQQPWEMRRRLKLVQQAKAYIKRHEGQLQERLAQSKSTKDIMARFNLLMLRYWHYLKREIVNTATNMIPWEKRIKEIESHFGSVVASYFTFLRWVFWINIVISAILICFVIVPEYLGADKNLSGQRKILLPSEEKTASHLSTLWDFEGILKFSPLFYGYYSDQKSREGFPLPLTYFMTALSVYIYSYVAILRRMAKNSRQSKLSEKEDECIFSWKVFTSWDFMIGNPETAFNKFASITMGFKEALLEEKEKKKDERNWKIISLRVLANFLIFLLLCLSAYAVVLVVERSETVDENSSWMRQNEITLVMSLITTIFPNIFELVGMLENYHPRKQLRWQLARIMMLNFLNLYTLIFALFGKVLTMSEDLQMLKANVSASIIAPKILEYRPCMDYAVNCTLLSDYSSYEAKQNNQAILSIWTNLTTLISDSSSLLFNETFNNISSWNSNTTAGGGGKLNLDEWWDLLHTLSPKTDVTLGQILNLTSNIGPDFSESWSEITEKENVTYWTNGTEVSLNETSFWPFNNKTGFAMALPMILKLISLYKSTVLPPIFASIKTSPMPTSTTPISTILFNLDNLTSTTYSVDDNNNTLQSDYSSTSSSTYPDGSSLSSGSISTSISPTVSTSTEEGITDDWEYTIAQLNKIRRRKLSTAKSTTPEEGRFADYTEPDWSRFPPGENGHEVDIDIDKFTSDEELNGHGEYDENGNLYTLDLGKTKPRNFWDLEDSGQSTRGDIPIIAVDETTTTTPAPTTTEPPVEEDVQKFLTNLLTKLTIVFSHNSTKVDEFDFTRVKDYAKWITWLESEIQTRRVGPETKLNTTFGANFQLKNENRDTQKCYITLCENGTTIPNNLDDYFNCSNLGCSLKILLGPRNETNCIVPHSKNCTRPTEPPPTPDPTISIKLRKLCWETMFGQELVKLTVMDLIFTVGFILVLDFIRAILVRILNPCWCWDLEKKFPQYGDFKIAENILHLVNNQGMICPFLPAINLFKLVILMYIRSWAVMSCNVPHETVFRASRSNNFYFALLLFMLFLCTLPVAYTVVWLEPSWHCGPFSQYQRIYYILTSTIFAALPKSTHNILDYIASPGIVIPLLLLLILIIYYLLSLTGALRESNNDLKIQLRRERTEERRKMFKLAGNRKDSKPVDRWKMILPITKVSTTSSNVPDNKGKKKTSIFLEGKQTGFAGAIKRAALKARKLEESQKDGKNEDDQGSATDVDQVSLSEDGAGVKKKSPAIHGSGKPGHGHGHGKTSTSTSKTPLVAELHKEVAKDQRKPSCTESITSIGSRGEIPVIKISKEEDLMVKKPEIGEKPKPPPKPEKIIIDPGKKERIVKSLISKAKEKEESRVPYIHMSASLTGNWGSSGNQLVVNTEYGDLKGIRLSETVEAFLGVPYASPPVGSLRFMPPVTPSKWKGVKIVDHFQPVCPQILPRHSSQMPRIVRKLSNTSEDCLFLNIYVYSKQFTDGVQQKEKADQNKNEEGNPDRDRAAPIVVIISNESFEWGSGNLIDGFRIASFGHLMVITLNYRLGVLGFLQVSSQQNFGLLDIIASLNWIKENSRSFGGDPDQITLLGYRHGAVLLNFLLISPFAKELFNRAILLSGSSLSPWALQQNPQQNTQILYKNLCHQTRPFEEIQINKTILQIGPQLLLPVLVVPEEKELIHCLRKLPLEELTQFPQKIPQANTSPHFIHSRLGPILDNSVIKPDYRAQMESSSTEFAKIPILFAVESPQDQNTSLRDYIQDLQGQDSVDFGPSRFLHMIRTLINNLYPFHHNEILSIIKCEYTRYETDFWELENNSSDFLYNSIKNILSDALVHSPLVQTANLHSTNTTLNNSKTYFMQYKLQDLAWIIPQDHLFEEDSDRNNGKNHEDQDLLDFILGDGQTSQRSTTLLLIQKYKMMDLFSYITKFIRTGNPNRDQQQRNDELSTKSPQDSNFNSKKSPKWIPYEPVNQFYLCFSCNGSTNLGHHYRGHKISLWLNLIPKINQLGNTTKDSNYGISALHHRFRDFNRATFYQDQVRPEDLISHQINFATQTQSLISPEGSARSSAQEDRQSLELTSSTSPTLSTSPAECPKIGPNNDTIGVIIDENPRVDDGRVFSQKRNKLLYPELLAIYQSQGAAFAFTISIGSALLLLNVLILFKIYKQKCPENNGKGVDSNSPNTVVVVGQQQQLQEMEINDAEDRIEIEIVDRDHFNEIDEIDDFYVRNLRRSNEEIATGDSGHSEFLQKIGSFKHPKGQKPKFSFGQSRTFYPVESTRASITIQQQNSQNSQQNPQQNVGVDEETDTELEGIFRESTSAFKPLFFHNKAVISGRTTVPRPTSYNYNYHNSTYFLKNSDNDNDRDHDEYNNYNSSPRMVYSSSVPKEISV